eukprot:117262-Rhodomonas_salina.2
MSHPPPSFAALLSAETQRFLDVRRLNSFCPAPLRTIPVVLACGSAGTKTLYKVPVERALVEAEGSVQPLVGSYTPAQYREIGSSIHLAPAYYALPQYRNLENSIHLVPQYALASRPGQYCSVYQGSA